MIKITRNDITLVLNANEEALDFLTKPGELALCDSKDNKTILSLNSEQYLLLKKFFGRFDEAKQGITHLRGKPINECNKEDLICYLDFKIEELKRDIERFCK